MPELPEVETVCRGLAKPLTGATITHAAAHRADLRAPLPKDLGKRLKGAKILHVERRAKYILIRLNTNETLLLHLGMSGRMVLSREETPLQKHDHISLSFDNGWHVRFNDPRRFGYCDLIPTAKAEQHKLLNHLGIEPLSDDLTPARLTELLKGKKTTIKAALLDQELVVGVGNIYACEALFQAGISPKRQAGKIKPDEIKKLTASIRKVLNAAIQAGGSSLRDYVQADGELGYFQNQFAVYGREGEACINRHGKKTVRRIPQAGRSTFYCPVCQK
jgi:formamidopyrimidine-DNA glycosylase